MHIAHIFCRTIKLIKTLTQGLTDLFTPLLTYFVPIALHVHEVADIDGTYTLYGK